MPFCVPPYKFRKQLLKYSFGMLLNENITFFLYGFDILKYCFLQQIFQFWKQEKKSLTVLCLESFEDAASPQPHGPKPLSQLTQCETGHYHAKAANSHSFETEAFLCELRKELTCKTIQ
ncbi:hypothetical protein NPIL_304891 [Nephila pilipes]|uniref:Uncharacterized protein n=1 Tax=Nephila pilipes TaxID=299642 RepID=A0A8X6PQK5_NEPPI|nr:hypothetical protein NPIL_304891 [Nephila pilipes]